MQQLFSARTLPLFQRLPAEGVRDYLSGLLIGSEIKEALSQAPMPGQDPSISVIGASPLADRYLEALLHAGRGAQKADDDTAARGHVLIARKAGLMPAKAGMA